MEAYRRLMVTVFGVLVSGLAMADSARDAWVVGEIGQRNAGLSASDRSAKYAKMEAGAYSFFRGTNHLFWSDFGGDSRLGQFGGPTTAIWLQGDLHAYNYGSFDDDHDTIVYDLNDFDEAMVADYQYDVWRMAVSLVLVARENGVFGSSQQEAFVECFATSYIAALEECRGNALEKETSFSVDNAYGRLDDFLADVSESESRQEMLDDWTTLSGGSRVFDFSLTKLGTVSAAKQAEIRAAMIEYGATLSGGVGYSTTYFAVKSIARRLLAGTGSLGTPRYYILIEGETTAAGDDRILDIKLQTAPSAYGHVTGAARSLYDQHFGNDHALRAVIAQRALGRRVDDHLGCTTLSEGVFSVRERSPFKDEFPTAELDSTTRFTKLAEQWGRILAFAHARSDKDFDPDMISYSFDKEVTEIVSSSSKRTQFAELVSTISLAYADQVAADYEAFVDSLAAPDGTALLSSGVAVTGSAAKGSWTHYQITVPAGAAQLTVAMTGNNDADLYVRKFSQPTSASWDYRPYQGGSNETVTVSNPVAGTWFVAVYGYSTTASSYSLNATITAAESAGGDATAGSVTLANAAAIAAGAWKHYSVQVPTGASGLVFTLSGSGDGDLYVRHGAQPTTSSWDYRPYQGGSAETVTVNAPASGAWHVSVRGYSACTVSLKAELSGAAFGTDGDGGTSGGGSATTGPTTLLSTSGSVAQGAWKSYSVTVPAGASTLSVAMTGSGDADLYVRKGTSNPTSTTFDFRPYLSGSNETVTVTQNTNPAIAAGTWKIAVYGYASGSSSFSLEVAAQ